MSRVAFGAKSRTFNRGFFFVACFACGLFGLVGVIVFRACCAVWLALFRLLQSSVAGKAELFVGFGLVPSLGACRAGSVQVDYVRVPSFWAVGAILFGGTVGCSGGPCGLATPCKVISRETTKNFVSGGKGGATNG